MTQTTAAVTKRLERIAKEVLDIATLETRNSDSLDYYDVAVWSIRDALLAAYRAGQQDGSHPAADRPQRSGTSIDGATTST